MPATTRRRFLGHCLATGSCAMGAAAGAWNAFASREARADEAAVGPRRSSSRMALGLVTYLWGKDWDLPTLLTNCEKAGIAGVELRTTHAHGVEPSLSDAQRAEVRKQFADSKVTFVGPGSNEQFDWPDPERLQKAIAATKDFIVLSHDCGGSGVKVKPNSFHKDVPREQTIDQIARSLNELGRFATGFGQEVRLEVHGQCAPPPIIADIIGRVDEPNVGVCWNSNNDDLGGEGLTHNFGLLRKRFGHTVHVRELNVGEYPYQKLVDLLVATDYDGWVLLECRTNPDDRIAALVEQRELFQEMVAKAT